MGNVFVNIPVPTSNAAGAAVDVSSMGKTKSLVIGGTFRATVNVEYATDTGNGWAPLATFQQGGNLTVDVACGFIRAVTSGYISGTPNLDVGSDDAGTTIAVLTADGASVDISTLPKFKTVVVPNGFEGKIEASEDGTSWAEIFSFAVMQPTGQSREFVAQFARVIGAVDGTAVDVVIAGASDGGGGGGAASELLSIYGDGSFGNYTTSGDETWDAIAGAPGAPAAPAGTFFPFAFFNNLTITAGDAVAVGGFTDAPTAKAVVIFVKGTLTIGAGGSIHVNGGDGAPNINGGGSVGGLGRNAIYGSISDGGNGADGNAAFSAGPGGDGSGGSDRPALSSATRIGGVGGAGGTGSANAGGAGGVDAIQPSWPYSLTAAMSIASILTAIGGGNGGGSGGNGASGGGGSGGGGAGTLVIFAKTIVAPAGSLQAIGGAGGTPSSTENQPAGGGGGGTGGTIIIVTDNTTLSGVTDVSGGAGSAGAGVPANPGTDGGPGEAIAFNPMRAAQIAV